MRDEILEIRRIFPRNTPQEEQDQEHADEKQEQERVITMEWMSIFSELSKWDVIFSVISYPSVSKEVWFFSRIYHPFYLTFKAPSFIKMRGGSPLNFMVKNGPFYNFPFCSLTGLKPDIHMRRKISCKIAGFHKYP